MKTSSAQVFVARTLPIGMVLLAVPIAWAYPTGLDGQQVVKVTITNEAELDALIALDEARRDVELWSDGVGVGEIDVRIPREQLRMLDAAGLAYEVLIEDLQQRVDSLFAHWRAGEDFFDAYRSYEEYVTFMEDLVAAYPNLTSMLNLGQSVQGRTLWALRISGPGEDKPGVMYHGGQHGNEITGPCVVAYMARHLLENYDTDPTVRSVVNGVEWFLLPLTNPDGYEMLSRHNANGSDLNRNWGGPGAYPGAFSQPETAAMRGFFLAHPNVRAHIDFHSTGSMILWPWGHTAEPCEDHQTFALISHAMSDRVYEVRGSNYGRLGPVYTTIYPVNGGSTNYTYGELGIWAVTFEIAGGQIAPTSVIIPASQDMLPAMMFLSEWVDNCGGIGPVDCNDNGVADDIDITNDQSEDGNGNGVPDECEVTMFVHAGAVGNKDGSSWTNAFTEVRDAITHSALSCEGLTEVWVAAGTYHPNGGRAVPDPSFWLTNQVRLYGGFTGWETNRSQRDPAVNVTILSGDLMDNDESGSTSENAAHVVVAYATDTSAVLDGFVITAGYARYDAVLWADTARGGGLFITKASPTIARCTFTRNFAGVYGGALYNETGDPSLDNCTFLDNATGMFGAGVFNDTGSPSLSNCVFMANTEAQYGGAMANQAHATLHNCLFSGNQAWFGGAIWNTGDLVLTNCTMSGNSAGTAGGVYNRGPAPTARLANCILWDNSDDEGTGESSQIAQGTVAADYSCIQGWSGDLGGVENTGENPLFVDTDGFDEIVGTLDDDLRLGRYSAGINTGDVDAVFDPDDVDLDGHARVLCGRIDMGAYEFGIGDFQCDQTVDLTDFANWTTCMTGPNGTSYNEGCEAFDFDSDHDVDLDDLGGFHAVFGDR